MPPDSDVFRITTWNCSCGSVASRLADLTPLQPDLVFLQECQPAAALPLDGDLCLREVNAVKGLAIAAPTGRFKLTPLPTVSDASAGSLAAHVEGVETFHVLGIWAQLEGSYARDVERSLRAHETLFNAGPVVVLGDFNSGRALSKATMSEGHGDLMALMEQLGLVSAYHHAHGLAHGQERHATYFHHFRDTAPWHIDFCFVPRQWASRVAGVEVGEFAQFKSSDHRPLTTTITLS